MDTLCQKLTKMFVTHLLRTKGLTVPDNISVEISNGIIVCRYEYTQIFINVEKETVILSEMKRSTLFAAKEATEKRNESNTLPPPPPIPANETEESFDTEIPKSRVEKVLPEIKEVLLKHISRAKGYGSELYVNKNGSINYPCNFDSHKQADLIPPSFTDDERNEIFDYIYDSFHGVEEIVDDSALVIHL